jgi:hypothetical protein
MRLMVIAGLGFVVPGGLFLYCRDLPYARSLAARRSFSAARCALPQR